MTLEEIDAEIAALEKALTDFLLGKRKGEVRYEGVAVRYGGDFVLTLEAIRKRIVELKIARARLTGEPTGLGPIRPAFGGRV